MYVLMDLEWYHSDLQFSPTQLAALRISDSLECGDSFYTRIRPAFREDAKYEDIAFTSGSSQKFLRAPDAVKAFRDLIRWLQPDDVLLWWHEHAAAVFEQLWQYVSGESVEPMGVLRSIARANFPNAVKKGKSLYSMTCACTGGAFSPEHYAKNDVENMLKVLREIGKPVSFYNESGCMSQGIRKPDEGIWPSALRWSDPLFRSKGSHNRIVHLRDCGCIRNVQESSLIRYANLKESLSDHCRICEKCSPLNKIYADEYEMIRACCASEKLNVKKEGQMIHIISRYDVWRILTDPVTGKLSLYHRSEHMRSRNVSSQDMSNFHRQRFNPKSILDGLNYIVKHDRYSEKREQKTADNLYKTTGCNPVHRNSKKGRKIQKKEARRQKHKSVSRVLALIDELSAMGI